MTAELLKEADQTPEDLMAREQAEALLNPPIQLDRLDDDLTD